MEINQELIDTLTIFEADLLKAFLDVRRNQSDSLPEIDQPLSQDECIYCSSTNIIKNGHSAKGRQRYLCKDWQIYDWFITCGRIPSDLFETDEEAALYTAFADDLLDENKDVFESISKILTIKEN